MTYHNPTITLRGETLYFGFNTEPEPLNLAILHSHYEMQAYWGKQYQNDMEAWKDARQEVPFRPEDKEAVSKYVREYIFVKLKGGTSVEHNEALINGIPADSIAHMIEIIKPFKRCDDSVRYATLRPEPKEETQDELWNELLNTAPVQHVSGYEEWLKRLKENFTITRNK